MTVPHKLNTLVAQFMGEIIKNHHLLAFSVSEQEVALRGNNYWLDVWLDRDGISIIYFDTSSQVIHGYNLLIFLLNRRRDRLTFSGTKPELTTGDQFLASQFGSLANHLKLGAEDILNGSKEWLNSYSWPTIDPSNELLGIISQNR